MGMRMNDVKRFRKVVVFFARRLNGLLFPYISGTEE